jgi:hypothetical protein
MTDSSAFQWKDVAGPNVQVDGWNVDCGHYIPEQAPDLVAENIHSFFE